MRLVEVALTAGAGAAYLVDYAREIDEAWLDGVRTVGVTSGASVPEVLVRGVLEHLAERGWGERRGGHDRRGVAGLLAAPRAAPSWRRRMIGATVRVDVAREPRPACRSLGRRPASPAARADHAEHEHDGRW